MKNYTKNNKCGCGLLIKDSSTRCRDCFFKSLKGRKKPPRTKEHTEKITQKLRGRTQSPSHRTAIRDSLRKRVAEGKNNFFKDSNSYAAVHFWLNDYFPKKGVCEICDSPDEKKYEYALIHGKHHERNRENYMELCSRCHREYDGTMAWQNKRRATMTDSELRA